MKHILFILLLTLTLSSCSPVLYDVEPANRVVVVHDAPVVVRHYIRHAPSYRYVHNHGRPAHHYTVPRQPRRSHRPVHRR